MNAREVALTMSETLKTIAVLGGSGSEGGGLALRWARAGHPVIIGSRDADKAKAAAAEIAARSGGQASGATMLEAAQSAEIVVLSVPFAGQQATALAVAPALSGKILIDVTVPLVPPRVGRVQLPDGGSAVEALQRLLGPDVRVVSAFQNISAHHLAHLDAKVECDVLVCSDDREACAEVIELAKRIGLAAWDAGPLANSAASEALTSVLITLNRRYKLDGAGIRITGMPG